MTRVLLGAAFSPMMCSIITEALSHCADLAVVSETQILAFDPACRHVDVVLTPVRDPEDARNVVELLWRWPRSRVVAVAPSGRTAVVYELFPRKRVVGDLSPNALVDAVCG